MRAKIDKVKLAEYLSEGKTQAECARIFDVSEMAISKAVRRFGIQVARTVGGKKEARELVKRKKTAMDRLLELADKCGDELEWIETEHPPSKKRITRPGKTRSLNIRQRLES